MPLNAEDLGQVAEYVKDHLADWLVEASVGKPPAVYEIELRERMVRVEEELKHQRELMQQGFALMEKRFEQVDKRFGQVDKRFEQVDKRFEQMEKRFEQVDKRLDRQDGRFELLTRRIDRFMYWSFGLYVTGLGVVLAVMWRLLRP
jgi:predicted RNase H-like nuclease (RuvC/YqgF family)